VIRLLIILFLAAPGVVWSQSQTISARVVDAADQQTLGFASVGIKGVPIGTISNAFGEFDFHFPTAHIQDTLVISMMGYENYEAPIRSLIGTTNHVIFLRKSAIELEAIVVSDTLRGADILRIALSRITDNYPMEPFLMEGFYRDMKKVGDTYFSLLEAAVKIYDEAYDEPRNKYRLRERVRLLEVRKSFGYESKYTSYFDQDNLLEDLLLNNLVRYHLLARDEEFLSTLERKNNSHFNGHDIYVVRHTAKSERMTLYIDQSDFSIVHIDYEEDFPGGHEIEKKRNVVSKFMGQKKSIGFRRVAGKMYLSYMNMTSRINWYDARTQVLKFETQVDQQLLVNRVQPRTSERITSTEKMRNYGLQYQHRPYNKAFWESYNVIKETPLDEKIIFDLEKIAPLEAQFQDN